MFIKDSSGKYKEVECTISQHVGGPDDITISPCSSTDMEKGEKKEHLQDVSGDGLSSVWLSGMLVKETNV